MKINRKALFNALRELARIAGTKTSLPILANVVLTGQGPYVEVQATDLRQTLEVSLPGESREGETLCIGAKLLLDIVRPGKGETGAGDVELLEGDRPLKWGIACDGVTIGAETAMVEDFPAKPTEPNTHYGEIINGANLLFAVKCVLPAVSKDEYRPHLNGMLFEGNKLVATDGHRLHLHMFPVGITALVPLVGVQTLARLIKKEDVQLAVDEHFVRAKIGSWTLTVKTGDAQFPPYENVIPKNAPEGTLAVNGRELTKVLTKLYKIAPKRQSGSDNSVPNSVTLAFSDGELCFSTQLPDGGGELTSSIDAVLKGDWKPTTLNMAYMIEAVSNQEEMMCLYWWDAMRCVKVCHGDFTGAVMPVRA